MSAVKGLIKSGAWLTLANVVSKLASVISLPILARLLGPESLGVYTVILSLIQSAQGFSSVGADIAIHRNSAQHQTIGAEVVGRLFGVGFALICLISVMTGLGVWIFREFLALHWLGQTNITPWLGSAAVLIVLQPFGNVPLLFLAGLHDFRAYALRSTGGIIVSSIVTVLLAWNMGLKGAVLGLVIVAIFQIFWSYILVNPVLQLKGIQLRFDQFWRESWSILKFGFPYYFGNTLLGSVVGLPLMGLVSQYGGLDQLGYLRVAQSMASLIGFIPAAIAPAAISYLSASSVGNQQSYQNLRSIHLRGIWILLLIPTAAVCVLLPGLIRWLYGSNYQQAIVLSWVSLWCSMVAGVISVATQFLVADGDTLGVTFASTIGILGGVGSAFYFIPNYGALGFLLATGVGHLGGLVVLAPKVFSNLQWQEQKFLINLIVLTIFLFGTTLYLSLLRLDLSINCLFAISIAILSLVFVFKKVISTLEQARINKFLKQTVKDLL